MTITHRASMTALSRLFRSGSLLQLGHSLALWKLSNARDIFTESRLEFHGENSNSSNNSFDMKHDMPWSTKRSPYYAATSMRLCCWSHTKVLSSSSSHNNRAIMDVRHLPPMGSHHRSFSTSSPVPAAAPNDATSSAADPQQQINKDVEEINVLFVEARDEIELASEDSETVRLQ